jgi:ribonuclease Z
MRGAEHVLIDCGEGTQRQLMRSVAGLRRLSVVLITHCHADHVLGLPGLLAALGGTRTGPLRILGPPGLAGLMAGFRVHFGDLGFPLDVREVAAGHEERREGFGLTALAVDHRTPALGWALAEDPVPGHLIPERLARLGVPEGPGRAALARGEEVAVGDGWWVSPEQVREPPRPGRVVVFSGDTRPSPAVGAAARGADLLVHEATFLERDRELAERTGHSTAAEAAALARDAGVALLALTHRSSRYPRAQVLAEARAVFPATVAPEDLDMISVPAAAHDAPRLRTGGGRHERCRD